MKVRKVVVLCEGESEKLFVKNLVAPYLREAIEVECHGLLLGVNKGDRLLVETCSNGFIRILRQDPDALVTSLVGVSRFQPEGIVCERNDEQASEPCSHIVEQIRHKIEQALPDHRERQYLPYVQSFEFESLLLCGIDAIDVLLTRHKVKKQEIKVVLHELKKERKERGPEGISDSKRGSPSQRIEKVWRYDKPLDPVRILDTIGLLIVRQKCHLFNGWLTDIENICKEYGQ